MPNASGGDAPGIDAPAADDPLAEALVQPTTLAATSAERPRQNLIRSSLIFSGMTLISRFMGFLRDQVITYRMGASLTTAADAYNTALAFPNLFRRIFAEGAFAAAFVPAYARALARDGEEEADILAGDAMATLAAATIVIMLVAQLAMPWLMYGINPGYAKDPEKFKLAVALTQITMPYLPCMAVVAHLSGVLNARGRFALSAAAPILLNLVMLVLVLPQTSSRAAAFAASWGVVAAGVLQGALLTWGVRQSGAKVHWRLPRLTPEIRALLVLAVPGAIAASATQVNIFVSGILASNVQGARSWLAVADRLYQLPLGLVGVAVGVALLPKLSTAVQAEDRAGAQGAMDEAVGFSMALTLPAAVALFAMPYFLIDALFTRGEFKAVDAAATASALLHYGWGTPAFVLARILAPAFFARSDTKAPMRFALVSVVVNIVGGITLFQIVGFQGIAAATSLAAWINVGLMLVTLQRRGNYLPGRPALVRLAKIGIASVVLAAFLAAASAYRPLYQPFLLRKEVALLAVVTLGGLLYFGLLFALRAVTPGEIRGALRRGPKAKGEPATEF